MSWKRNLGLGLHFAAMGGILAVGGLIRAADSKDSKTTKEPPMPVWATTAVKPKELSDNVKKGLEWLAKSQQDNGGWSQGGGWRMNKDGGGRVEGGQVQDPADLGNTCIAVLALVRAGSTPTEGPYAKNVAKGIEFICKKVEAADGKSLTITDVKGTQLHSKIGPFVDTFLTTMVLAEVKGRGTDKDLDKRMVAALDKTVSIIEKNQKEDGTFAGNNGWASVLSQGLAMKGLNRAAQAGGKVDAKTLERAQKLAADSYDPKAGRFKNAGEKAPGAATDAGIGLYGQSADLANLQETVNTLRGKKEANDKILADPKAKEADKNKAKDDNKKIAETEKLNEEAVKSVAKQAQDRKFVAGFGNNGGEEFLSFMNISETLLVKGGEDWEKWDKSITDAANKAQDKDGSWQGHHCITGKTFCTAAALLVLTADRAPIPVAAKNDKR